jgi:hypothetical protein
MLPCVLKHATGGTFMPSQVGLGSLKRAESDLKRLKAEAENDQMRLKTAEHKRLLRLLKARMAGRITEDQFWIAVGQD